MEETLANQLPLFTDYAQFSVANAIVLEQFRRRETVHAYLLSGAKGLGKATFAKVLACALFCTEKDKPCGHCLGCQSVLRGQNPDVFWIEPEGGKQMGVERVRDVIETISQHAFGTGSRMVIIEPVEKLTPQAQNCLLKSLEEPVSDVVFLLLAHEMTALLGTIASRCARLKLTPWPDPALESTLKKLGYAPEEIQRVLPVASGNIGQAKALLSQTEDQNDTNLFLQKALGIATDADVVSISTGMKEDREGAERYLHVLEQAVHQALLVRTGQLDAAVLRDSPSAWQTAVPKAPPESLLRLMRAIFEARRRRNGQVNWQSTIDQLMMKILEERRKWQQ